MKDKLLQLFNQQQQIEVPRPALVSIVAPLMPGPGTGTGNAPGNEALAKGWDEAAEWLRIGFDGERDKGMLYEALHFALRSVARSIRQAPADDTATITVSRADLAIIRDAYPQFSEATMLLQASENSKKQSPPKIVQDRNGNPLVVPPVQIYNRPHENHAFMAAKLTQMQMELEIFFEDSNIKPASMARMKQYVEKIPSMR